MKHTEWSLLSGPSVGHRDVLWPSQSALARQALPYTLWTWILTQPYRPSASVTQRGSSSPGQVSKCMAGRLLGNTPWFQRGGENEREGRRRAERFNVLFVDNFIHEYNEFSPRLPSLITLPLPRKPATIWCPLSSLSLIVMTWMSTEQNGTPSHGILQLPRVSHWGVGRHMPFIHEWRLNGGGCGESLGR